MLTISVVIPNLHSPLIGAVLDALLAQGAGVTPPVEVVVVGQDRYQQVAARTAVRHVVTPQPVSAATARNLGVRHSTGDVVAFLDSDCIPDPGWLTQLQAHFANPNHQVVAGGVRFTAGSYWDLVDNLATFYAWWPNQPARPQTYIPTLNMAVRRSVIDVVGGLDERFPGAAGEDIDWALRMRRAGYTLGFAPHMSVEHRPQRGTAALVWRRAFNFARVMLVVRQRYPDQIATPLYHRHPFLLVGLAPLMAGLITAKIFLTQPDFWRFWYAAVGVYWAKLASRLGGVAARTTSVDR